MAYVINQDDCLQCGSCEFECENQAISQVDGLYVIDPAKCESCGDCVEACPNGAIIAD